ncbi:MAG: Asp23/Gls24 family envelope stress response protein [Firmicutes bacterium]|nr:Asp23/Gls24 family envelope stress response protein [Bacillota bacterium]
MFEISNELGQIHFSRNVLYRICSDAADLCEGNVRLQNYKGRYTTKRPGLLTAFTPQNEEDPDAVEIQEADNGILLKVYVVVRFGISMNNAANTMIDHIYQEMESLFGQKPLSVTIVVTGTASKTIAKRHIEFIR